MGILDSIIDNGLLLTPEEKLIADNPQSSLTPKPVTRILQKRASFTAMRPEQLAASTGNQRSHSATFGHFAIGIDAGSALELGMIPTFYLPVKEKAARMQRTLSVVQGELGQDMIYKLADIRNLLCSIAAIEHAAHPGDPDYADLDYLRQYGLVGPSNDYNVGALRKLSKSDARKAFRLLDSDRPPAFVLAFFVEILLSAFQQVDSPDDNPLEYYDQNEWRIVHTYSRDYDCHELDPSVWNQLAPEAGVQARRLHDRIRHCLSEQGMPLRADECSVLRSIRERPFIEYVDEVVVPDQVGDAALRKLSATGLAWEASQTTGPGDGVLKLVRCAQ